MATAATVRERLAALTAPGSLARKEEGKVRCLACGHRCLLGEGREGVCRVRFVREGELRVPWGYVATIAADPIEKKPFFHVLPGSTALSFGMLGCDFRCPYCQNWEISQTIRDADADAWAAPRPATPEGIVAAALAEGAAMVTSTYNEPLITAEWAGAVFREARRAGLMTSFVSNGNATEEVLDFLRPLVDAYKVDLKGMREEGYRRVGGRLAVVLDALRGLVWRGIWVEVVTLVVPGLNDSPEARRGPLPRVALPGPPVARDGLPPRLQDGGDAVDPRRVPAQGRGDRTGGRPPVRLHRKRPRPRGGRRDDVLRHLPGAPRREAGFPSPRLPDRRRRRLPAMQGRRAGPVGGRRTALAAAGPGGSRPGTLTRPN
ncbi:MAG: radical SAM protein [Thermoanaerobaculia bacterium]|nr:radical SAM protein [Thermoanaerobaculia bacterium]